MITARIKCSFICKVCAYTSIRMMLPLSILTEYPKINFTILPGEKLLGPWGWVTWMAVASRKHLSSSKTNPNCTHHSSCKKPTKIEWLLDQGMQIDILTKAIADLKKYIWPVSRWNQLSLNFHFVNSFLMLHKFMGSCAHIISHHACRVKLHVNARVVLEYLIMVGRHLKILI